MITAEQVAESLINGAVIHDNAVRHEVGLMERVEEIVKGKGLELRHESDVYIVKGHDKLAVAKKAKDDADKAAAAAALAAEKAEVAKMLADQAAKKAELVSKPVGPAPEVDDVAAKRAAWDEAHGLKPGEYDAMTPEEKAKIDAMP
jgi:hypothetical protein